MTEPAPETGTEKAPGEQPRSLGAALLVLARTVLTSLTAWIMAGEGSNKLWRLAGLIVLGTALVRAVDQRPLLTIPLGVVIGVAAVRYAPRRAKEAPEDKPEEPEPEEELAHPADDLTRDELADLLRGLLQPTGGVHLTTLAGALPGPRLPTRAVRDLLTREDIRVRAGVRAPGVGVREGVHRDDIPAPLSPTSEPAPVAVVAAGQSNNNNGEKGLAVEEREGMTIIRDLADRARRHRVDRRS